MKKIILLLIFISIVINIQAEAPRNTTGGFSIEGGYGMAMGGLGVSVAWNEKILGTRCQIFAGIGLAPEFFSKNIDKDLGFGNGTLGFGMGMRFLTGRVHSFVSEISFSSTSIIISIDPDNKFDDKLFGLGMGLGVGYQYMSDNGFMATAIVGLFSPWGSNTFLEEFAPYFTISTGYKFASFF